CCATPEPRAAPGRRDRGGGGNIRAGDEPASADTARRRSRHRRAITCRRPGPRVPPAARLGGRRSGLARPATGALGRAAPVVPAPRDKEESGMTEARSVSAAVEVPVDPATAFSAFTEELGRITVWEPGARLSWTSSVDDVEIDVLFVPISSGTNVRVRATILAGGTD